MAIAQRYKVTAAFVNDLQTDDNVEHGLTVTIVTIGGIDGIGDATEEHDLLCNLGDKKWVPAIVGISPHNIYIEP